MDKIDRIYYKNMITGKTHWVKPLKWEWEDGLWFGKTIKVLVVHREKSTLTIPSWAVSLESVKLLSQYV